MRDGQIPLNPEDDGDGYDLCVLAIKPQMFPDVLPVQDWPNIEKTLFVSIAAGMTIETMGRQLSANAPGCSIIRTMPNLPAAVQKGATLLCADHRVDEARRAMATRLFEAAGAAVWVDSEDQLDRLMGVSGCGPAYVFLLAEALEEAAIAEGASPADARVLAEMTVIGAAEHLATDPRPAGELRAAVTSPGGTTAAALSVLDDEDGLRSLTKEAVLAAYRRAGELAS